MAYRVFDHTADLGVEISAASVEEIYAGAAVALFDLLVDLSTVRAGITREIVVTGEDQADLLVNFLREALYLWNGEGFLIKTCSVREAGATAAEGPPARRVLRPGPAQDQTGDQGGHLPSGIRL